jgi:probable F420-dependent oxidoreductase
MTLKLGFFLPQNKFYNPGGDAVRAAQAAERIGYDSVWAFERLLVPEDQTGVHRMGEYGDGTWPDLYRSVADPLITLATAAAVTSRIRLGTAVVLPPLHMPFRLAKTLASLSAASGGRLVAGLGNGWSIDEHLAAAPRPLSQRGAALDEFLDMADAIWGPDPVSFDNERYTVIPSEVGPKPPQRIPVLLGGQSEKALDRTARRASGWLPSLTPPAEVGAKLRLLREKAAEYGRNPADLSCTVVAFFTSLKELPGQGRPPYNGSIGQIISDLADLAAAGADEVILTFIHACRDINELIDVATEFHERSRAAGI